MPDSDPIDEIEVLNTIRNLVKMSKTMFDEFIEQGFTLDQAFQLTKAYIHGTAGGKFN